MKLPTLIALFSGAIFVLAESVPVESDYSKSIQDSVNKLSTEFTKILLENGLEPEKNAIFSPLNIYTALAMVHLGANGTTRAEISSVLGLPADDLQLSKAHENFGQLLRNIQSNKDTVVKLGNGVFVQKGFEIKNSYLQGTKNYYESETQQLDFAKGGPEPTHIVNKWVASKTGDRISKLFDSEISKDTVILLASALYFAGKWQDPFWPSETKLESFNTGVKQIQVQTMNLTEDAYYSNNKDLKFEAISLPYLYGDFSMLIILPHRDQSLNTLINSMKSQHLSQTISSLRKTYVNYKIPRMKFQWTRDINEHLTKLGIKQIFTRAELDNMVDSKNLVVSKVTHAAEIEVDEEGTVATAVTAFQIVPESAIYHKIPAIPFYVNRSFLFSIYHRQTGLTLFTGVVQNPTP